MIEGIFHQGSGLGNQLHRYIATRVLALDKEYDFGMINPDLFKGSSFMNLDMGRSIEAVRHDWTEKKVIENGVDIRGYDPEINFIEDGTIIDGEFQDPRYFEHRMNEVNEWLKVKEWNIPDYVCVIGFRGGEYYLYPELGLPVEYFYEGMRQMLRINPRMKFEVHTDDPALAKDMFARGFKLPVIQDMALNWTAVRYAKYAIVANSSFYILPRLLRHHDPGSRVDLIKGGPVTIAPRYWARHNTKVWALPQNYYKQFTYI